MKTLADVEAKFRTLGVSDADIERICTAYDSALRRCARQVENLGCGLEFYDGHTAEEAAEAGIEDSEGCPPFEYVWVRFDFNDDMHYQIQVKLLDELKAAE